MLVCLNIFSNIYTLEYDLLNAYGIPLILGAWLDRSPP
jgi:hypothetical protein